MTYNFKIKVKQWFDKPSKSWIIYYKKCELCAYGSTKKKAKKMFDVMIHNILYDSLPNHLKK